MCSKSLCLCLIVTSHQIAWMVVRAHQPGFLPSEPLHHAEGVLRQSVIIT